MSDLKRSTKKAIAWSALDKGGQQLLLLLVNVVITRNLDPDVFGLVAPLALFTGFANILSEGGFSAALVRKTNATERDYNTMFWFNFGLGVAFYLLLYALSPWIAHYNGRPELLQIARIQFLAVIFYSLGLIQSTRLVMRSDFRRLGMANVGSIILAGAGAFILLYNGYGVWAYVGMVMGQAFFRMLLLWILARWRPRLQYSWKSFREMFRFSSKLILGALANNISLNFYASALGEYLQTWQVGSYERAHKIKETAAGFFNYIFGYSIYLMLSQLQDQPGRFLQAFRKSVRSVSFFLFPAMLGLGVMAKPFIEFVLTAEYLPSAPLLRILCFSGILYVLNYFYGNALKVRGRSDVTLGLEIVNAVLIVSFLFLTIRHGLEIALMADIAARLIVFVCYAIAASRLLDYRLGDQLRDLLPYAALSLAMAALIWPLQYLIHSNLLLLIAQLGAGGLFYWGVNKLLGSKVLEEIHETIRGRFNRS